jgi:hypothetical protein
VNWQLALRYRVFSLATSTTFNCGGQPVFFVEGAQETAENHQSTTPEGRGGGGGGNGPSKCKFFK